jgi:hypothetical protein
MSLVLQFELILKIGSIKCAYGGRQKNISRAPRWAGLLYSLCKNERWSPKRARSSAIFLSTHEEYRRLVLSGSNEAFFRLNRYVCIYIRGAGKAQSV